MEKMQEFDSLLHAECLGFYNCCEVITAFLSDRKDRRTYHFITVFVMEERPVFEKEKTYLTDKPVRLSDRFCLGCQKKLVDLESVRESYKRLSETAGDTCGPLEKAVGTCGLSEAVHRTCDIGDGELTVGRLKQLNKVFVPQDSTKTSKLNRILKNNFRNGSYVMEFFDVEKTIRDVLGGKLTQKAAEELYGILPIDLFTVSDRIGSFLFQFPSSSVHMSFREDEKMEQMCFKIETERRLADESRKMKCLLTVENPEDDNMVGFGCQEVLIPGSAKLYLGDTAGLCTKRLVDCKSGFILCEETGNLIREIGMRVHMGSQFGKEREIYNDKGELEAEVSVVSAENVAMKSEEIQEWKTFINDRRYKLRMEELDRRMEFIQYGVDEYPERERALSDIRKLMNRGDGYTVYLWDPYLNAQDLLDTWYYTTGYGMELKCITSAGGHEKEKLTVIDWMEEQKKRLEGGSNQYGISVEFRCQWGTFGYGFHDRFLMIVDREGKKASEVWSLGASLNSLGTRHHIIQKVLHPQPVVDAFERLWDMLPPEHCQIWKHGG